LRFTATGRDHHKDVNVSQSNFAGRFTLDDPCKDIASVRTTSNSQGKATFEVIPRHAGRCTVTFVGAATMPGRKLAVTVAP
jgi:hypothetical protein